jgi:hypothetical protein
MYKSLTAALLLALSQQATAVSTIFTYQGSLVDGGAPADGSYDLRFELIGPGPAATPITLEDVAVSGGVFSVELDFDVAIASGDYSLAISVRPGPSSGAFTTLAPTTPIRPTPQAQVAAIASEAASVSPNAVNSAGIADGTVGSVDIADGGVGSVDIDTSQVQVRVGGTCASGNAIATIAADGTVTCQAAGSVTSIATGAGLTGGPITSTGTISIGDDAVTSNMIEDGAIGAVDIDSNEVQRRVGGTCAAGSSIRAIAEDGSVSCEETPSGANWLLGGNSGTNPASNFLGTTDAQPFVLRTENVQALRIEPSNLPDGPGPNTASVIAGSRDNAVTAGARGATVMGGGATFLSEGSPITPSRPNLATEHYALVAGGWDNVAGNSNANPSDASFATVLGGANNRAEGREASVFGGYGNRASGLRDAVVGGLDNMANGGGAFVAGGISNAATGSRSAVIAGNSNCAGGENSLAMGSGAKVRPATGTTAGNCASVTSSGDLNGDEGAFAWADSSTTTAFASTGPNQFLVRADGGLLLNTNARVSTNDDMVLGARQLSGDADADLRLLTRNDRSVLFFARDSNGSLTISLPNLTAGSDRLTVSGGSGGAATLSNGGTWTNASSRAFKTGFLDIDALDVLERVVALSISRWTYKDSAEGEHMGPMAEDFKAAFNLGGNGQSIATVDADGVALAAIQGLNQKLEAENAELRRRLDAIEARIGER